MIVARLAVAVLVPLAGVEDDAVLVHLDERRAVVRGGLGQDFAQMFHVGVHCSGHKTGFGAKSQRQRLDRPLDGTHGR